jgi:hypothetical protein
MTSTEEATNLLSSTSPSGVKAREFVVETARLRRFMVKGITRHQLSELEAVSVLNLSGKTGPEWTAAYHFELEAAIKSMTKALEMQQVVYEPFLCTAHYVTTSRVIYHKYFLPYKTQITV